MNYEGNIQWFPGHMTKTKRMIQANLKLVDAAVEIIDSRIPISSRNPILPELLAQKPTILLLNKSDFADPVITEQWQEYYKSQGQFSLVCDCRSGKGINAFIPTLKNRLKELLERRKQRGNYGASLRVMVLGIPNVGKSSFINRMAGSRRVKVEDRPGVTRGKQWVSIDKEVELLDMPGILWPKFEDKHVALNLAFTGAIRDAVMDTEELGSALYSYLSQYYPQMLQNRFKLNELDDGLAGIAKSRGMLFPGGEVDTLRAATILLDEFRSGKIGRITLEKPPSV
jgi:ribosome biogenesis GTPase A